MCPPHQYIRCSHGGPAEVGAKQAGFIGEGESAAHSDGSHHRPEYGLVVESRCDPFPIDMPSRLTYPSRPFVRDFCFRDGPIVLPDHTQRASETVAIPIT